MLKKLGCKRVRIFLGFLSLHVSLQYWFIQSWFMKIASFICLQQRIISSLYCFTCIGFPETKTNWGVSEQAYFILGGGIYARTKIKPSIIMYSNSTIQIKKSRNLFFIIACGHLPFPSVIAFPSLYPCSFSFLCVSSHFLSVKGCSAFKILIFAFAVLCIKSSRLNGCVPQVFEILRKSRVKKAGVQKVL